MEPPTLVPHWLSTEFLAQCLQQEPGYRDIVVTKFTTSRAAPLGENHLSCPTRVQVEYKKDKTSLEPSYLSLVVKSEVNDSAMKDVTGNLDCSEYIFYNDFLSNSICFKNFPYAAKSFFSPKYPVIVLEDLKEKGFVLANKTKGLDFEHCRLFVTALASLHAVSFAVLKEDPGFINTIGKEKTYSPDLPISDIVKIMVSNGMRCLAEYTESSDRFNKYTEIIKQSSDFIFYAVVEAVRPREGELNAINHGDVWTSNAMFKYDNEGSPCEVKLLDFQVTRYTSPLTDVVYFVWTSASDDVRTNRLDELFTFYVEQLNEDLKRVGCPERLSYESAMIAVGRLRPLAIQVALIYLLFSAEQSVQNLEPFLIKGQEEKAYQVYKSFFTEEKFCSDRLPKLVQQLESAGVFEYLEKYKALHID